MKHPFVTSWNEGTEAKAKAEENGEKRGERQGATDEKQRTGIKGPNREDEKDVEAGGEFYGKRSLTNQLSVLVCTPKVGTELDVHAFARVCSRLRLLDRDCTRVRVSACVRVTQTRAFSPSGPGCRLVVFARVCSCSIAFEASSSLCARGSRNARARPRESTTLRCIAMWNTSWNIYIYICVCVCIHRGSCILSRCAVKKRLDQWSNRGSRAPKQLTSVATFLRNLQIPRISRLRALNHSRWQLIADHNEWPNRIQ